MFSLGGVEKGNVDVFVGFLTALISSLPSGGLETKQKYFWNGGYLIFGKQLGLMEVNEMT